MNVLKTLKDFLCGTPNFEGPTIRVSGSVHYLLGEIDKLRNEIKDEQANSVILRQRLIDLAELAMNGERCELLSVAQAIIESEGAPIHDKI